MEGYVCSVVSAKGGVGKTTTAVNLGVTLAESGHDVVVVDGDLEMPNLARMLGLEVDRGVHSVLAGEAPLEEAIVEGPSGMSVVPGDRTIEMYESADPSKLGRVLELLRSEFDLVLVDTGSRLSNALAVVVGHSDGSLCLSTPSTCSVLDAGKTLQLIDRAGGDVVGGVLTRVGRTDDVDDLVEQFEMPFLGVVPTDFEAAGEEPVTDAHPDSDVADAYIALAGVVEQVVFDGVSADDVGMAVVEGWFDSPIEDPSLESDDDQGGSFAMFQ